MCSSNARKVVGKNIPLTQTLTYDHAGETVTAPAAGHPHCDKAVRHVGKLSCTHAVEHGLCKDLHGRAAATVVTHNTTIICWVCQRHRSKKSRVLKLQMFFSTHLLAFCTYGLLCSLQ